MDAFKRAIGEDGFQGIRDNQGMVTRSIEALLDEAGNFKLDEDKAKKE